VSIDYCSFCILAFTGSSLGRPTSKPTRSSLSTALHLILFFYRIGKADCTDDGKELCEKFEVRGYPSLKYFVDGDTEKGEDYKGGRDLETLQAFVEEKLEVKCDVSDPKECSDKERAYIEKMKSQSEEERKKQLQRLETMKDGKMKPELKQWLTQRVRILIALAIENGDEL